MNGNCATEQSKKIDADRSKSYFGNFGGQYVSEILMPALQELEEAYKHHFSSSDFQEEFRGWLKNYAGRPSLLYRARNLEKYLGRNLHIYLKREDLNHTGAHKINNCLGQAILARKMGKNRIIAETGAGQHGVATATVAALMNCECDIYMGAEDVRRQQLNVFRMELLGARVIPVHSGSNTLKDAMNEALRDWVTNISNTYYLIGSTAGPYPYPEMVRNFQMVIGEEVKQQLCDLEQRLPDYLIACVGGGSNAMGLFYPFFNYKEVKFIGVEAAGHGIETGKHAATLNSGRVGVLHGSQSYLLQDKHGQISLPHSISAGLDYPGVGPEHSYYKDIGRCHYYAVTDKQALEAFKRLSRVEGIIPALESSHAVAYLLDNHHKFEDNRIVVVNLSGRGDKDVQEISELEDIDG